MFKYCIFPVLLALALGACSTSSIQTSASNLKMVQESIIIAAKTADRLCDDGTLSEEQCTRSTELYTKSREIYQKALEAELFFIEANLRGIDSNKYFEDKTTFMKELVGLGIDLKEVVSEY